MSVNYVLYCSTSTVVCAQADLLELLKKSRVNNEGHRLSGMLLFRSDKFIQWLEGPKPEIDRLLRKIERDRRHKSIRMLSEGVLPARAFADWSMAFKNLTGVSGKSLSGYSEVMQANADVESANMVTKKLVQTLNGLMLQPK